MKYKLAFLFTQPPFGSAMSREGLDALLAASAFCDEQEILILFLNDGVFNLVAGQQPNLLLQKDHIATFKLIELYDLTECYICQESLTERKLDNLSLTLTQAQIVLRATLFEKLKQAEKVLTF